MTITLNGTTGIVGPNGTASVPAMTGVDTDSGIVYGTNTVQIATGGATAVTVDSSQNVGIGTSSPTSLLDVRNGTGSVVTLGKTSAFAAGQSSYIKWQEGSTQLADIGWDANNNEVRINNRIAGFTSFYTSNTERMRLDSSGNLLVGTTSTNSGATQLLTLSRGGVKWSTGPNSVNGGFDIFNASSTGVYLPNNATSWSGLSDETMKDIIEPITDAVNKVATLRTVIGKYKTDEEGTRRSFLIAQDVQAVLPEAVNENHNGKLGLQYTDVIPLLVASIKELNAKVTALEAQLGAK